MIMDWSAFQKFTEVFFSRDTTKFTIEPTQICFNIREKQFVFTEQEYKVVSSKLLGYNIKPTFIYNSTELESLIIPVESGLGMRYMPEPFSLHDESVSYNVSKPSHEMILSLLSSVHQEDIRIFRRGMPLSYIRLDLNENEDINLFDLFHSAIRRVFSLKIIVSEASPLEKLQRYCNSFLFNYSYSTGTALKQIMDINDLSLDHSYLANRRRFKLEEMETPKLFYKSELTEQYNLGLSSSDPFICFIAFYHIMEHFFDEVYNGALINSVREILTHPGFSIKRPKEISKIISLVQNKTRFTKESFEGTELEALELTIKAFVPLDQVHNGLHNKYPDLIQYYRTHEVSFSNGDTIDLSDFENEKLPKRIAARIYKTRNSLVHSKSNDSRVKERGIYHPFANEKELTKEIPLMKLIAEIIIIRSAKEI